MGSNLEEWENLTKARICEDEAKIDEELGKKRKAEAEEFTQQAKSRKLAAEKILHEREDSVSLDGVNLCGRISYRDYGEKPGERCWRAGSFRANYATRAVFAASHAPALTKTLVGHLIGTVTWVYLMRKISENSFVIDIEFRTEQDLERFRRDRESAAHQMFKDLQQCIQPLFE